VIDLCFDLYCSVSALFASERQNFMSYKVALPRFQNMLF